MVKGIGNDPMVKALTKELEEILRRAAEIKKFINDTYVYRGASPLYTDVDYVPAGGTLNLAHDQYFGKGLATAGKEFLQAKGRAAPSDEIFEAFNKGGFEWPTNWKERDRLKNLAISLSKNRYDFVIVRTSKGQAYGLYEFYPEKMKERERKKQGKSNETESANNGSPATIEKVESTETKIEESKNEGN